MDLYINGTRVDLHENSNITLNYQSNLMSGIDNIKSGYSLSIKLPKTPVNDFLFTVSDLPASNERQSYKWHNALLVIDGAPIVKGKASLMSATAESYEVSLVWGEVNSLKSWLDRGETLRDLPITDIGQIYIGTDFFGVEMFAKTMGQNVAIYDYNSGIKQFGDAKNIYLPVVKVGWLFNLILSQIEEPIDTRAVDLSELDTIYMTFTEDLVEVVNARNQFAVSDVIPEIKQLDFVKAICLLKGWYFEQNPNGALRLIDLSPLSNYNGSVDWSDKVISDSATPDNVDFSYESDAQRNWLRYKVDENVQVDADGYLSVDDETLETDKTIYTLPFAPTDADLVVQYTYELESVHAELQNGNVTFDVTTTRKFVKTEPRLLELREDGDIDAQGNEIPYLGFWPALYLQNIINSRYRLYQSIIREPLVVTVELNLSVVDLATLDYTKPIYIARYGCYFAIIELQYSGELTKAKLIKLP